MPKFNMPDRSYLRSFNASLAVAARVKPLLDGCETIKAGSFQSTATTLIATSNQEFYIYAISIAQSFSLKSVTQFAIGLIAIMSHSNLL